MTDAPLDSFEQFMTRRLAASTAFIDGDIGPLIQLSTVSSPATVFGPAGTTVQGWEQVNAANTAGSRSFEPGGSNTFDVMHHAADGGLAYWVGVQRSVVHLRDRAEPVPMELRVTEIFRWEDDDWKLVHRHADPLRAD